MFFIVEHTTGAPDYDEARNLIDNAEEKGLDSFFADELRNVFLESVKDYYNGATPQRGELVEILPGGAFGRMVIFDGEGWFGDAESSIVNLLNIPRNMACAIVRALCLRVDYVLDKTPGTLA